MNIWRKKNLPLILIKYKRTVLWEQRQHFKNVYNSLSDYKKMVFRYILDKNRKQKHRLHVVSPSPWPIYSAACAFLFVYGMVLWMHGYTSVPLICGVISLISAFFFCFCDIIREGVYMGYHTSIVNSCLRLGFVLFLVSEVMFFFGFFWALFHFTLTPSISGGGIWPPQGIVLYLLSENINVPRSFTSDCIKAQIPLLKRECHIVDNQFFDKTDYNNLVERNIMKKRSFRIPKKNFENWEVYWNYYIKRRTYGRPGTLYFQSSKFYINFYSHGVLINPYKIPLLNTVILITSGFVLTLAHSYLRVELFRACFRTLLLTIYFGIYFILLQLHEYSSSGFSINDGAYGSIFYMLTGFHGFHVIIGTIFLIVCLFRLRLSHFTANNHFAFEAAAWYWHFVDVVWILLYLLLYLWPNDFYFTNEPSISFLSYDPSIFINMPVSFFFENCCSDPNFKFRADINFSYCYKKKLIVLRDIINYYEDFILRYEDRRFYFFDRLKRAQRQRLFNKVHW